MVCGMSTISKKICLVGDFGVGKTSLIRRFVDRQFSDQYLSTVGVKISRKTIRKSEVSQSGIPPSEKLLESTLDADREIQLLIWDIEGSTQFRAIAPSYLQGAKGAIIVGDLTRRETLDHLTEHLHTFRTINPGAMAVVALNKSDLVDAAQQKRWLESNSFDNVRDQVLGIYATSAKMSNNVDPLFQVLVNQAQ